MVEFLMDLLREVAVEGSGSLISLGVCIIAKRIWDRRNDDNES